MPGTLLIPVKALLHWFAMCPLHRNADPKGRRGNLHRSCTQYSGVLHVNYSYNSAEYFIDRILLLVHHRVGFCLCKLLDKTNSLSI